MRPVLSMIGLFWEETTSVPVSERSLETLSLLHSIAKRIVAV